MPYANPEDRKRWSKRWKKHGKEIGYNKWLYDRRKLRFEDAAQFREALERIAGGEYHPQNIAKAFLNASAHRYKKVGPSPRVNGVLNPKESHDEVVADSLFEAVAKLGLK